MQASKKLLLGVGLSAWMGLAQAATTLTDLAGRSVTLPEKVERIILGESRYIPALAILEQDQVVNRVVGMMGDMQAIDPDTYRQYQQAFPNIDQIKRFGRGSAETFSLEQALALKADVAIFGLEGHGPGARDAEVINTLEQAGVAVVFIDFRHSPLENTPRSMEILGEVLGQQQRAADYLAFYQQELNRVTEVLAKREGQAPSVFLHSRVGLSDDCCEAMAKGMLADLLAITGARNIATELLPGSVGVLNPEYLITRQPDIYIGTAIGSSETQDTDPQYLVLGTYIKPELAQRSLHTVTSKDPLAQLNAVKEGRASSLWHHFYNTPLNVVAVQAMAKWVYPQLFAELEPQQTLSTLYQRFQPVPLEGTYWMTMQ